MKIFKIRRSIGRISSIFGKKIRKSKTLNFTQSKYAIRTCGHPLVFTRYFDFFKLNLSKPNIFHKKDAEDLSPEGKELVYNESIKYTNILLRYNQRRLGLIEGAQRLAECFRLINRSIETEYTTKLMLSHQLKYYSMDVNHFKDSDILKKLLEKRD